MDFSVARKVDVLGVQHRVVLDFVRADVQEVRDLLGDVVGLVVHHFEQHAP